MKISEILSKYETDKVKDHNYGGIYNNLFSKFDRNASLNILEIGTQKGGSLCAWQDYFPNSNIIGVDIIDAVKPEYKRDSITYINSDIKDWISPHTFDIIIDDGSHFASDVAWVIKYYTPQLNKGGVLIVEDIQNSQLWSGYELIRCGENYDDMLLIIRR